MDKNYVIFVVEDELACIVSVMRQMIERLNGNKFLISTKLLFQRKISKLMSTQNKKRLV